MTRGRRLVEAFAAAASRYAPEDEPRKRALLADLEGVAVRDAGTLLRLHEALCFLQAYPDNAKMLEHVDRALERFGARVHRLGTAARPRLHDSGVTHTILDYPFGFPMARWLAARRAFERLSLVAALIPDLSAWSLAERRALLSVMRAKGSGSEMAYARRLDGHRRLRRSLEALARA